VGIVRQSTVIAGLAIGLPFLSGAAGAATPLPDATMFANASGCYTAPCMVNDGSEASTSVYGVPVTEFGKEGSYTLTEIYPGSGTPSDAYVMLTPNTPGYITSVGVGTSSVALTDGNSGFTIDIDRDSPSGGGQGATGNLVYYFEVINVSAPMETAPVSIGVSAKAGFSGTASEDSTANPDYNGDGASATASLLITPGPGATTLSETEETNFSYLDDFGTVTDTLVGGQNSSNMQITFGPTSTFSGSWDLTDAPITVNTDTRYEVQLYGTINGSAILDATLFDDPEFSLPAGYELVLSPGVSNGVPEPASWALMLVGSGALGGALRSARRRTAVASLCA